jgi:hypothetical protein
MTTLVRPAITGSTTRNASGYQWRSFVALGLALIGLGALAFYNLVHRLVARAKRLAPRHGLRRGPNVQGAMAVGFGIAVKRITK